MEMKLELLRNHCSAPEYKEECGFLVSIQRSDPFTVAGLPDFFLITDLGIFQTPLAFLSTWWIPPFLKDA